MRYCIALFLLIIASATLAQPSRLSMPDSTELYKAMTPRPLPPSMLMELRRSQKNRTMVYQDTVHASDLERQHFNDSVAKEYSDSAFSLVDTAVSLPHKEWLDSELVEIPELARFGSHLHFNYPPAIMSETDLRPVPFDSTLVAGMNPVTRENLPFFDQSPIPMPLAVPNESESFLEAGAGNVNLPLITAWLAPTLSERSSLNVFGDYRAMAPTQSAIHNYANVFAMLGTQFGEDPSIKSFHSQDLNIRAAYSEKTVARNNLSTSDHTVRDLSGRSSLEGDVSEGFHYHASIEDHELSDGISTGTTESSQDAAVGTRFDLGSLRLLIDGAYAHSSLHVDTGAGSNFFGTISIPASAQSFKAVIGERGSIEWYAGAEYLGGTGPDGTNYSTLMPVARMRLPLNARWELGGSFEPQVQLASLRSLLETNPFYAPEFVLQAKEANASIHALVDGRSLVMDKINFAAFMNYILSPDDELRLEARFITRDREPVFDVVPQKDSSEVFTVVPQSTARLELTAAANFLLFTRDVLTGSAEFISATSSGSSLPYEPNFKLTAEYRFNSIWENAQPSIAFRSISRPDRTLTVLDANVNAQLTRAIGLTVRAENILGSASDFWPGFPEDPRSIWASVRYRF